MTYVLCISDHDWDVLEYAEMACSQCQHRQHIIEEEDKENARRLQNSCSIADQRDSVYGVASLALPAAAAGSAVVAASNPQFQHCGTRRDGSAILVFPDDPSLVAWPPDGAPDGPGPDFDRALTPAAAQLAERRARLAGSANDGPRREVVWDEIQARPHERPRPGRAVEKLSDVRAGGRYACDARG
jgi:hypothetical protein